MMAEEVLGSRLVGWVINIALSNHVIKPYE